MVNLFRIMGLMLIFSVNQSAFAQSNASNEGLSIDISSDQVNGQQDAIDEAQEAVIDEDNDVNVYGGYNDPDLEGLDNQNRLNQDRYDEMRRRAGYENKRAPGTENLNRGFNHPRSAEEMHPGDALRRDGGMNRGGGHGRR